MSVVSSMGEEMYFSHFCETISFLLFIYLVICFFTTDNIQFESREDYYYITWLVREKYAFLRKIRGGWRDR